MNYDDYSNQSASEKIGLCIVEASKRLMGWAVHAGLVYKIENQDFIKVVSIVDSGTVYTEVASIGAITAGKWYYDRSAGTLYLQASDSSNPNSRFLVSTFRLYFANVPVIAPHDLSTGFDIEWLPLFKESSEFGVEIDTNPDQLGIAIEGSGSLTMINDKDYWPSRFGRYVFENKNVYIYSWSRQTPITEAKIVFRGKIQEKEYSFDRIRFTVKDTFNQLRQPISLDSVGSIPSVRVPLSFYPTKKRQIYGFVDGFRPQNIDQVIDGYPISGTVTSGTGNQLTCSGTSFLSDIRPSDTLVIEKTNGSVISVVVQSVTSNTVVNLTDQLSGSDINAIGSATISVLPALPKEYSNRVWQLSNHVLCEPLATVIAISGPNLYQVDTIQDFEAGDLVLVGSSLTTVRNIVGTDRIRLSSFTGLMSVGSTIKRVTVTNVKINDTELEYLRDYSYSASLGQLTLEEDAEFNIASTEIISGTVTLTPSSDSVTGLNTSFSANLTVNSRIFAPVTSTWHRVIHILNDEEIRIDPVYAGPGVVNYVDTLQYKTPEVFREGTDVLTCSLIGATEDGTVTGNLIKTVPQVVEDLLMKAGLSSEINSTSFDDAAIEIDHKIGLVIPDNYNDRAPPSIRDIINQANRSVFGILTQNENFDFEYSVISPDRAVDVVKFLEDDYISLLFVTNSSDTIKSVSLNYADQEYNSLTKERGSSQVTASSDRGAYLVGTKKEIELDSILYTEESATIMVNRWKLFLEIGRTVIEFETKLRASRIRVTNPVQVSHRLGYQGENGSAIQLGALSSSKRTVFGTRVLIDDFADSFVRCAAIASDSLIDYASSSVTERLYNGFITDQYGLIDNDAQTNETNLIW